MSRMYLYEFNDDLNSPPILRASIGRLIAVASVLIVSTGVFFTSMSNAQERVVPASPKDIQLSFAPIVRQVTPAVVNVYTKRVVRNRSALSDNSFFDFFFGRRGLGVPRQRIQNSLGSGVIVGSDGVIVTNNHVIEGGEKFTVVLSDRREYDAEIILIDERTDLAVLRIDTKGEKLPSLRFANSDLVEVGDLVLAIGNPFGVGQTVTSGIISAVARTQVGISDYQFFIQTDAAINPGNSGGALVDISGNLVGVNTAIFSRSGGSNGIGFAIPSNMVRNVVESATSDGRLMRPWLGVKGQVVTSELAESLGLDRPVGVLINEIHSASPVLSKGLRVRDVIISVDDFSVFDPQSLNYRIATKKIGNKVVIGYVRNGRELTTKVKLIAPPENPPRNLTTLSGNHPFSGATVANLSPAFAEERGFDWMQEGVVLADIAGRSLANRYGFKAGDIILSVNGQEIDAVDTLEQLVRRPIGRWDLTIRRGDRTLNISIRG